MSSLPAPRDAAVPETSDRSSTDGALDEFGLTAKQRAFADQILAGAQSAGEAARAIGCEGEYAYTYASRTIRSRAVQEYIRQSVGHTLAIGSARAVATMVSLLDNKSGQVKFWAARDVLDRTGFMAKPTDAAQPTVTITIDLS